MRAAAEARARLIDEHRAERDLWQAHNACIAMKDEAPAECVSIKDRWTTKLAEKEQAAANEQAASHTNERALIEKVK